MIQPCEMKYSLLTCKLTTNIQKPSLQYTRRKMFQCALPTIFYNLWPFLICKAFGGSGVMTSDLCQIQSKQIYFLWCVYLSVRRGKGFILWPFPLFTRYQHRGYSCFFTCRNQDQSFTSHLQWHPSPLAGRQMTIEVVGAKGGNKRRTTLTTSSHTTRRKAFSVGNWLQRSQEMERAEESKARDSVVIFHFSTLSFFPLPITMYVTSWFPSLFFSPSFLRKV